MADTICCPFRLFRTGSDGALTVLPAVLNAAGTIATVFVAGGTPGTDAIGFKLFLSTGRTAFHSVAMPIGNAGLSLSAVAGPGNGPPHDASNVIITSDAVTLTADAA